MSDLRSGTARLRGALSGLTPERSRFCFTHRLFGTMSLYQVGDFAIAHMVRHNQQAKQRPRRVARMLLSRLPLLSSPNTYYSRFAQSLASQ